MEILLTGGTGFIGRALVEVLLARGDQLQLWVRSRDKAKRLFGERVSVVTDLDEIAKDRQIDAVINLAGEPIVDKRWSEARKRVLLDSRIGVTRQLIKLFERLERRPAVIVSGSAIGYYGSQVGDEPLGEAGAVQAGFAHQLCLDWEAAAKEAAPLGVRVCCVRTGIVLGQEGGALSKMLLPYRLGLGGAIGDGRQWMSWIHLRDMLEIICFLLENPQLEGVFNATAPEPVRNGEFSRTLAHILKRPAFFRVPALGLRLALGEAAQLLVEGQRVVPRRLQEAGFQFRFATLEAALRDVLGGRH